ncbi:hypothetical protein BH09SUM1_BH09SUM1_06310 [soil metagenome]
MSKIFLLGTGPLLEDGARIMSGQCLRTWHFAAPLIEAKHEVTMMTVPIPGATRDEAEPPTERAAFRDRVYTKLLSNDPARILSVIAREIADVKPDAIVGVNAFPAFLLAKLNLEIPFWADLNGWTMAEGMTRAAVVGHDRDFGHFWRMEAQTLLAADRFSTVTERQAYALYGELAMIGRLDESNFAEDFACAVPNAVYPDYASLKRSPGVPEFLRGKLPDDAAICLWSGGFNTWTDVDLLTRALANAMAQEPRLHFVSTGGAVHGHDESTYEKFTRLAAERLPAGRSHQLGWVDFPQVLDLHACAHVGINIDGDNVETRFGARNRLTNMLGAGTPVLTTQGTEIAKWIEDNEAGAVTPQDASFIARGIGGSIRMAEAWEARAAGARDLAMRDFAAQYTLIKFLEWAAAPHRAPRSAAPHSATKNLRGWVQDRCAEPVPFSAPIGPAPHNPAFPAAGRRARIFKFIRSLTGGRRP